MARAPYQADTPNEPSPVVVRLYWMDLPVCEQCMKIGCLLLKIQTFQTRHPPWPAAHIQVCPKDYFPRFTLPSKLEKMLTSRKTVWKLFSVQEIPHLWFYSSLSGGWLVSFGLVDVYCLIPCDSGLRSAMDFLGSTLAWWRTKTNVT